MVLSLPDRWIWDFWLARDDADWHIFFLQAEKSLGDPELRHWNVSQGHAIGPDLVNWTHLGTSLEPSPSPAWDDYTTWTGSVIRGPDGLWHQFYTGTCRAENGLIQRVGHTVSEDLHNWQRLGSGLALDLADPPYELAVAPNWHDRAMRDPWVMPDPNGHGYLMYFTARVAGLDEANAGGAIGLATSPDLYSWTLQPPVFTGQFGQLEVPQVFEAKGKWYCLFCTSQTHWSDGYRAGYPGAEVTGTHYLIGDSPRGPWRVAPGPFLDGADPCHRYAGRVVQTDDGLFLMGFIHNPDGADFVGQVSDPIPVEIGRGGLLHVVGKTPAGDDHRIAAL